MRSERAQRRAPPEGARGRREPWAAALGGSSPGIACPGVVRDTADHGSCELLPHMTRRYCSSAAVHSDEVANPLVKDFTTTQQMGRQHRTTGLLLLMQRSPCSCLDCLCLRWDYLLSIAEAFSQAVQCEPWLQNMGWYVLWAWATLPSKAHLCTRPHFLRNFSNFYQNHFKPYHILAPSTTCIPFTCFLWLKSRGMWVYCF